MFFRGIVSDEECTYLIHYVGDGPGQVEAAFAEAGSFKSAADMGLCRGVHEFFDADDEDGLDGVNVPQDLREAVAVAEEGHDHAVGVQVSVDPDGGLNFCEVFNLLAQDLFGNAFVVVLVQVGVSGERQGNEVGN